MNSLALHFAGPYKFAGGSDSLFSCSLRKAPCVYLWTIRSEVDGHYYIHYVGEAMSFAARQREHLIRILGLDYGIFDEAQARRGACSLLWKGLWRDSRDRHRSDAGADNFYAGPVRALQWHAEHSAQIVSYVNALSVFVAEVNPDEALLSRLRSSPGWNLPESRLPRSLRRHLEGAIGWNLRNRHPSAAVLYPPDQRIGTSPHALHMTLHILADQSIAGLDSSIAV